MIRLRESIERWLQHRWLGPVVLVLLVLLFGMLAFHQGVEELFESGGGLCVALALFVLARFVYRSMPSIARLVAQTRRGPPRAVLVRPGISSPTLSPLRL